MAANYLEIYKGTQRIQTATGLTPGDTLTVVVREDLYPGHVFAAWVDRDGNPLNPQPEGGITKDGNPFFYFTVRCDSFFKAMFRAIVTEQVVITPEPNDPDLGETDGGGTVDIGDIVDISASDIPCKSRFVEWRKKRTGEFASYSNPYTVLATESTIYEAVFEEITYKVNLNVNNRFYGTATQSGDVYFLGDTVTLVAEPFEDSTFLGWYEDGVLISDDLTFEYTIEPVSEEECKVQRNITAMFEGNLYDVNVYFDTDEMSVGYIYYVE